MLVNVSPSQLVVGTADNVSVDAASSMIVDSGELIRLCVASLFADGPLWGLYVCLCLCFGLSGVSSSKPSFNDR